VLAAWARRRKTAQALALRSRIVLACAAGAPNAQVAEVTQLLARNFPGSRFLSAQGAQRLYARLADLGIAGGAVYDALVAAAAAEHGITLATRDRRASETYRALQVDFELID
jgi:predicted nucleic acid-binding protein